MKRSFIERLERRKDAMVNALWSNSNYDDDKGTRKTAIEEIEENFEEAVSIIHGGAKAAEDEEEEIDENNPFFAPAMRAVRELEGPPVGDEATVKDVVDSDYTRYIDQ